MSEDWVKRKHMEHAKTIAEEHWDWIVTWIELIYKDCMVHGYGHGHEDGYAKGYADCKKGVKKD